MTRTARKLALLTAAVAALAALVAPAAGMAAPVKFGAKLDPTVQPSNSLPGLPCIPEVRFFSCSMVQNEAYGRPDGGHIAPKTGTIKRIRLIAGGPGETRIYTAKVRRKTLLTTKEARIFQRGPKIVYQGQSEENWESGSYRVESFPVDIKIKKGEQLAVHAPGRSPMVRCSSGGDNTLIYSREFSPKHPFNGAEGSDGCWLLLEAVYK